MKTQDTILYINYRPYENAGHILTYLRSRFRMVILLSLAHQHISGHASRGTVAVYAGNRTRTVLSVPMPTTGGRFDIIYLPLRIIEGFLLTCAALIYARKVSRVPITCLTVNAFNAATAIVLRNFGLINRTVYWVWDHYPITGTHRIVDVIRHIYRKVETYAVARSDRTGYLTGRLAAIHHPSRQNTHTTVVPIGTNLSRLPTARGRKRKPSVIFLGVLKHPDTINALSAAATAIAKAFPDMTIHIIGGGSLEPLLRSRLRQMGTHVRIHGYIPSRDRIGSLLAGSAIGLALLDGMDTSVYTDHSKIKAYLEHGIPVIASGDFPMVSELVKQKAGIRVSGSPGTIIRGMRTIMKQQNRYQAGARKLARAYDYRIRYSVLFD